MTELEVRRSGFETKHYFDASTGSPNSSFIYIVHGHLTINAGTKKLMLRAAGAKTAIDRAFSAAFANDLLKNGHEQGESCRGCHRRRGIAAHYVKASHQRDGCTGEGI